MCGGLKWHCHKLSEHLEAIRALLNPIITGTLKYVLMPEWLLNYKNTCTALTVGPLIPLLADFGQTEPVWGHMWPLWPQGHVG